MGVFFRFSAVPLKKQTRAELKFALKIMRKLSPRPRKANTTSSLDGCIIFSTRAFITELNSSFTKCKNAPSNDI
jgi:hypothetical protein